MKHWYRFSDNSIAFLEDSTLWTFKPTHKYTSYILGFGEWIKIGYNN